jgi:hypothetical protein
MGDLDNASGSKAMIPEDWTQERKNGRVAWKCPEWCRAISGGWGRCSVPSPRHRIPSQFVPIDEPLDPVVVRSAVLIPGEILRHLSILAAQLDISARAATSEAMTEFINGIIATMIKYIDAHHDHIHEPSQIFRPVTDKTLTQDMLRTPDE